MKMIKWKPEPKKAIKPTFKASTNKKSKANPVKKSSTGHL